MGREPQWVYKWRCTVDEDLRLHQEVMDKGYPNRWGARRPLEPKWNLDRFEELLGDYEDKEVVEWMRFGWPTGRLPMLEDPGITTKNHAGATERPISTKDIHSQRAGAPSSYGAL